MTELSYNAWVKMQIDKNPNFMQKPMLKRWNMWLSYLESVKENGE